jgi:hypothetical protein
MKSAKWIAAMIFLALRPDAASAQELTSSALGNIFLQGEMPAFTLRSDARAIHWRAQDFFGREVAAGDAAATGGIAVLRPQLPGTGYFKLDISLAQGRSIQTALAILPPPSPSPNSAFGVVTHFAKDWPTDILPLISKAGIIRIRDEQPWRRVEKSPGHYDFPPRLSDYMDAAHAQKIDPLIVLAFANPLYDNDQTPFDEQGRAGYAAYAGAVAQRYRGQVSAVEVWNEYNGSFCDGPCRADRPATYAAMLKQTYTALKAANPAITVAGGAAVPIPLDYFDSMFRHGALDFMDAVVIHPYRKTPEGVEDKLAGLRQMMQRYGKPKPIWATEFGDTADMHKNRDDVARYLVRMSTLLLAGGTERIYWYLLKDYQQFAGMGLLLSESDPAGRYVPAPAYAAYAVLIKQLDGAHFVRRESSDPQAWIYVFSKGGNEIRVAWSTGGKMSCDIASPSALQELDIMGNGKSLPSRNGKVTVALDENPVYLAGATARP